MDAILSRYFIILMYTLNLILIFFGHVKISFISIKLISHNFRRILIFIIIINNLLMFHQRKKILINFKLKIQSIY